MTVIRPTTMPEREFQFRDTVLTFQNFVTAGDWHVRIDPDPLGVVNRIVRLMNGDTQVRATLAHIPEGATVELVRDDPWSLGTFCGIEEPAYPPALPPGWRVTVNGETVLAVTDEELRPPYVPPPPPPLWRRARNALRERTRAITDRIAARLGYHRDGECEEGW